MIRQLFVLASALASLAPLTASADRLDEFGKQYEAHVHAKLPEAAELSSKIFRGWLAKQPSKVVIKASNHPINEVREAGLEALGQRTDPESLVEVIREGETANPTNRIWAMETYYQRALIGDKAALEQLRISVGDEPDLSILRGSKLGDLFGMPEYGGWESNDDLRALAASYLRRYEKQIEQQEQLAAANSKRTTLRARLACLLFGKD